MTDSGDEYAWHNGFSDEVKYFDDLCNKTIEVMRREFEYLQKMDEDGIPAFFNTKKVALAIHNSVLDARYKGFDVNSYPNQLLPADDIEDEEVVRNLNSCRLQPGEILDVFYTPQNEILKYYNLFYGSCPKNDINDDVCFTKNLVLDKYYIPVWVGSPVNNSDERAYIIKKINEGFVVKVLITNLIKGRKYSYRIIHRIPEELKPISLIEEEDF